VTARIDGVEHSAGFLLWLSDGLIEMLEGFTYVGPWPDDEREFTLEWERVERVE